MINDGGKTTSGIIIKLYLFSVNGSAAITHV